MITNLAIWLGIALFLSVITNILLIWYVLKLIGKFTFISENLDDLVTVISNYRNHLKQVYKMEMFYGDETLEYLMTHTNSLLKILEDYDDVYSIAIPLEEIPQGEEEIEGTEPTETEETQETEEIFPVSEENVFYAGSRERNS